MDCQDSQVIGVWLGCAFLQSYKCNVRLEYSGISFTFIKIHLCQWLQDYTVLFSTHFINSLTLYNHRVAA